ncbi:flavin reductase [Gluconacetobacter entanii]|uniref:Flavin reductase n=1 Tax=Gluconacetobacter entanii TaxID=108528 RepID=A0A318PSK0_9PROT|nr:flavin reductase [Gluconacetobacter entanii]MCE2578663.1 flavin reductase [Komagataeibacter sp. FNDCR1]PYD61416.1 flavin reductase [Gluconacetobacter entanii]
MTVILDPRPAPALSTAAFRDGMAALASAISIVTTDGPGGAHGFTASAVCSVSDTPPTVLVCINRTASAHPHIVRHGVLAINVLHAGQSALSDRFASRRYTMAERFAGATWRRGATGAPLLEGALASLDCRISDVRDVGTHAVVFAHVIAITHATEATLPALLWFRRGYGRASQDGEDAFRA